MTQETPNPSLLSRFRTKIATQRYASDEYKAILETLLIGSFVLLAVLTLLLFYSYFVLDNRHVIDRIFVCGAALIYLSLAYGVRAKQHFRAASRLLILFYFTIASIVMFGWGVDTTFSQLMLAITIVLAGILLGSNSVIVTAVGAVFMMFGAQFAVMTGSAPWFADPVEASNFGDVLGFSALLGVLALISVLAGKHTQKVRAKDLHTYELLEKEKGTLELRVRERSEELKNVQFEKMEQLYKFAEIGQLSAALLHDIANHLTVLNLDIADLKKQPGGQAMGQLEESIDYIELAIAQARQQLQVRDDKHRFDIQSCINDSLKLSRLEQHADAIKLHVPTEKVWLSGEPLRLSHILIVLIRNAIEAYPNTVPPYQKNVSITLTHDAKHITIRVTDAGAGITPAMRDKLFTPLRSTKKNGLGIGLYIARQITEEHFKGKLILNPDTKETEFILTIPKDQPAR